MVLGRAAAGLKDTDLAEEPTQGWYGFLVCFDTGVIGVGKDDQDARVRGLRMQPSRVRGWDDGVSGVCGAIVASSVLGSGGVKGFDLPFVAV